MKDEDEEEDIRGEEDHEDYGMDEDFKESSTIGSGVEEGEYEDIKINIEWDYEEVENSNWAPIARAHRRALELLAQAIKTTYRTTTKEIRELERR
jgi:hypothetical protein